MKQKLGILTFQSANNYGAALQAFALSHYVRQQGQDCEVIDYRCSSIEKMHSFAAISLHKNLKKNIASIAWNVVFLPRRVSFFKFRKRMQFSGKYDISNIKESNKSFDTFITGSDQVFNLELTGNDLTYYLNFADEGKKKCSYAASMGRLDPENTDTYKKYLARFDSLSIREKSTAEELEKLTGKKCVAVPDPVFLLSRDEWMKQVKIKNAEAKKKYILVYALDYNKELIAYAQKAAEIYECGLVIIARKLRLYLPNATIVRNAGPEKFLRLLASAFLVVGNSFHGTALSLIFGKQFFVQIPETLKKNSNRITDLLEIFGLENRILNNNTDMREQIDYGRLNSILADYARKGKDYLAQKVFD